ncbi:hypothetical protein QU39_00395, partial [Staphylococcus aureus]
LTLSPEGERETRSRRLLPLAQQPDQLAERLAQLLAMGDHVDQAVLAIIFRGLEIVGQLLADRVLEHAAAGEGEHCARLGNLDVAQHRIGGHHAARGRVGQHDDIGQAGIVEHLDRHGGARHLHQREYAFLHARAARGSEGDIGRPRRDRGLDALDERLAHGLAHRAAHEGEVLHADHCLAAEDRARG